MPEPIVQLIPVPLGRWSVNESPVAVAPPWFASVTPNPAGEPASTDPASALLLIVTYGLGLLHDGNLKFAIRVRQLNDDEPAG